MKIENRTCNLIFSGIPNNYSKIDKFVSRSAQPQKEDFVWLKDQGITDVINFRTMYATGINFDEEQELLKLGINYHNIPSITNTPLNENVEKFLKLVDSIINKGGKVHIHCKAGADRTGMYSFIYKGVKGLGTIIENEKEWISKGHNTELYPDLRNWAKTFLKARK